MSRTKLIWVSLSGINPALNGDVAVYDMDKEKIVGIIPLGIDPRYLAWFYEQAKVYVPNYGSDTVSVIHSDSLSVIKAIPVGIGPKTVVIDNKNAKGYVTNYDENSITMIDLHQDEVIATVPVGLNPIGLVLSKDGQKLYVTLQGENAIALINTDQNQVVSTLPLGPRPNDLALTTDDSLLFVVLTGENRLAVVDGDLKQEVASIPLGRNPQRLALHPTRPLAYVTIFNENSLNIISTEDYQVLGTIPSLVAPFDLALNTDGSKLLVTNDYQLSIIDTDNNRLVSTLYAPPSAQIRQGITFTESDQDFLISEEYSYTMRRPYSYVMEKVYFKTPQPFSVNLDLHFPTPIAKPEKLIFEVAEVIPFSESIVPFPQRPNYYFLSFTFRIPIKVIYRNQQNQTKELHNAIQHVASALEIYLPLSRISEKFTIKISTQSEVLKKSIPTPNSLKLTIRTHLIAMQQVHIKG